MEDHVTNPSRRNATSATLVKSYLRQLASQVRKFVVQQVIVALTIASIIAFNQHRGEQLSREALRRNAWSIFEPYLVLLLVAVAYHAVATLWLMAKGSYESTGGDVVLTDPPSGRIRSRSIPWLVSAIAILLLGGLGYEFSQPAKRPDAPQFVLISAEYDLGGRQDGQLVRVAPSSPCLEKGVKVYSLNDLTSYPGGSHARRPWLVLNANHYSFTKLVNHPELFVLMFDVSLVNRGEASIAKDWSLCVIYHGNARWFGAEDYSAETKRLFPDRPSIKDTTFSNPVEHGHGARGWLLFTVPSNSIREEELTIGSLQCKDYLDHKTSLIFGFETPSASNPPSPSASGGLKATVH